MTARSIASGSFLSDHNLLEYIAAGRDSVRNLWDVCGNPANDLDGCQNSGSSSACGISIRADTPSESAQRFSANYRPYCSQVVLLAPAACDRQVKREVRRSSRRVRHFSQVRLGPGALPENSRPSDNVSERVIPTC